MTIYRNTRSSLGGNRTVRLLLLTLALLALVLSLTLPAYAAEDDANYSDEIWRNGTYYSTLGDMAGRRLYVYGIVDSAQELPEDGTDADVVLNSGEAAGRLDAALYLYRICGTQAQGHSPFTDVPEEYKDAVDWLYEAGVTKGISSTLYGTGNITEYQALVMLSRLLHWGTEDREEVFRMADSLGLLSLEPDGPVFTCGQLYQILSALLDYRFPERCVPARAEMSIPMQIFLEAESYEGALRQIRSALLYLPRYILVRFTEACPREDIDLFRQHFDRLRADAGLPIIGALNLTFQTPYALSFTAERDYRLWLTHYSDAYTVRADAQDWLRVYADEAYSEALRRFEEQYLLPLGELASYHERIVGAHELLCSLAAYDYSAYENRDRPQAYRILGFIENRSVVCDGYARAYQWMLLCLGIDSYEVVGIANGECHAWNKVRLEDSWYNVDACWGDGWDYPKYLLKSDAWFQNNQHSFTDGFSDSIFASPSDYKPS